MSNEYLTREELAALLRVTPRTIHNYERAKAVPAPVKVGRKHLWKRSDLMQFLKSQADTQPEAACEAS